MLGLPIQSTSVSRNLGAQIKHLDVQFPRAEQISNLKDCFFDKKNTYFEALNN